MPGIHPTAVIASGAELGDDVTIGPYCVIGENVRLGKGSELKSHVVLDGFTTIGSGCSFYPFVSVGSRSQDLKYRGGEPKVEIGNDTTLREYATVNAATEDGDTTRVGSGCLLMSCSHVAHDCIVGNEVVIANCGLLAGHVILEDQVIIGGLRGVHQCRRVGCLAMVGACTKITKDIPPFMMADGAGGEVRTVNQIGMQRKGIPKETQRHIKEAFRIIYRQDLSTRQALEKIGDSLPASPEINHLVTFIEESERGIAK